MHGSVLIGKRPYSNGPLLGLGEMEGLVGLAAGQQRGCSQEQTSWVILQMDIQIFILLVWVWLA